MNLLPPEDLLAPDMQGWNCESSIFQRLVSSIEPCTIVEVGTWKGMSAMKLYKAAQKVSKYFRLICIDTWLGGIEHMDNMPYGNLFSKKHGYPQLYYQFLSNMQHNDCMEHLHVVPNTSINGARWLSAQGLTADLIYIDGSHESPDVYYDISKYYDILDTDGIMFGDDCNYPPVRADLNRFCAENNIEYRIEENNYWVISKSSFK